jgi:two-component system phosphate regulon sensor histidine kinase PhoR
MNHRVQTSHTDGSLEHDNGSHLLHVGIISFSATLLVILFAWFVAYGSPHSRELAFNPYAVLSILSCISNIIAFIFIVRIKRQSNVLAWFSVCLLSLAAWAGGEAMLRLAATPAADLFWAPLNTAGSVIMPIALYMFALTYTNPKRAMNPLLLPGLIGVACFFIFLDARTNLIAVYDASLLIPRPWGFVSPTGPAYFLISAWVSFLPVAAIYLLHRFRQHTTDKLLRKQTKLFMIAIAVPLAAGAVTDGLLPVIGVQWVPTLGVAFLTLMGVIISYGITKYRFFSFTPESIANEILGTMHEAVIGIGPNLRIGYINPGAERLLGLPAIKMAGKPLSSFLAHSEMPLLEHELHAVLSGKASTTIDAMDFKTAHDKVITTTLTISRLSDEGQCLVVMTDITEMAHTTALIERQVSERTQELHEEQAKLRASIEGLTLGFMIIDHRAEIIIQNKALKRIFGLKNPLSSLQQLEQKMTDTSLTEYLLKVIKTGKALTLDNIGAGTKILQIFIGPVNIAGAGKDAVIGTVILIEDVTEEKVLSRSKDEFFSIASHELRTPLTSIKGNASMMLNYYPEIIDKDPSLKQMTADIYESSARLIDIVRDFLDVSRIEQGKMVFRYEPVAIERLIETIFYEMKTSLDEKKIFLKTDTKTLDKLPKVWADKDRLSQILYNLIGNAVKFTEAGGVTVEAAVETGFLRVSVTDTGRGISLDNQKLLFHKFQQAGDSLLTRDTTRGTGLGLYISRLMIDSMGGEIQLARSEENKGATFTFRIPIATKQQLASVDKPPVVTAKIDAATGLSK